MAVRIVGLGHPLQTTCTRHPASPWRVRLHAATRGSQSKGKTIPSLHASANAGHLGDVTQALAAGAAVNARDDKGFTPLHLAAGAGHADVVSSLLAVPQIDVDVPSNTGATPLVAAAGNGHLETVQLLLDDKRANPAIVGLRGRGAMHGAALYGHHHVVAALLRDARAPVHPVDETGRTPALDAAHKGRVAVLRALLQAGALTADQVRTLVDSASAAGHVEAAKALSTSAVGGQLEPARPAAAAAPLHGRGHAAPRRRSAAAGARRRVVTGS